MLTSLAYVFLLGLLLSWLFGKMKLPGLIGLLLTGILLGPYGFNLLDGSLLSISAQLRQLALVVILTRAGLSLTLGDLKKAGRPAVLLCFVPACFEMAGIVLLAPVILGISRIDAAIMGAVLAAVSPAVVVPRMLRLMDEGWGKKHRIPQMIMAGASVDDVFVIVVFTAFTSLASGEKVQASGFIGIPVSIAAGAAAGCLLGLVLAIFFKRYHMRDSVKLLIILSVSFLLLELETRMKGIFPLSGLLAIMSMGITLRQKYEVLAERLSSKYNKLWVAAEILLFVLVGAAVDISYSVKAGVGVIVLVCLSLVFRMAGAAVCMIKTKLTGKERLFCMAAYTPKATVQAAIGGVPLAMGLGCGPIVLTAAVIAILITAPFGAICMDRSYKKLLTKEAAVPTPPNSDDYC